MTEPAAESTTPFTTPSTPQPVARLAMLTLDCADPRASAAFWSAMLGWDVAAVEDEYAMLTGPTHALGFGRVDGHQPPSWPDEGGRKQFHLDLAVADLDEAQAAAVALGATVADPQPGETWRVLLDPAGHPFCLTKAENWG
jgi:catechol 2,3-dioxygenase-like lactoylglutathione lyase family enzyme